MYNVVTMKIINEIQFNNAEALRLFTSTAHPRKNNLRIHYHSLIEVSLILRGKGKYKTKDAVYSIKDGDVFFFRPNEAHCITDVEEDGMELLNLHIAPYYLYTNFQNSLNTNYIKILTSGFPLISNKINDTLPDDRLAEICSLILATKKEFEEKKSDYVPIVCNYISAIFILISRAYNNTRFSQKEKQNYQKLIQTMEYIDAHFKENITLDTLSQNVAYSRCYFSSMFKKCMEMSIWDYISIKRIETAITIIKTTDKSILEIALECGFSNTVNFNKIFKKYTNLSPGAFRK